VRRGFFVASLLQASLQRATKKPLAIAKGFVCFVGKTGFEPVA